MLRSLRLPITAEEVWGGMALIRPFGPKRDSGCASRVWRANVSLQSLNAVAVPVLVISGSRRVGDPQEDVLGPYRYRAAASGTSVELLRDRKDHLYLVPVEVDAR
jgi:hypothetical protein